MKAGGVERGRGEEAPGYHRDTVELMDSRAAVCMWLTPWLTVSLRHPQTSPVNWPRRGRERDTERERERERDRERGERRGRGLDGLAADQSWGLSQGCCCYCCCCCCCGSNLHIQARMLRGGGKANGRKKINKRGREREGGRRRY